MSSRKRKDHDPQQPAFDSHGDYMNHKIRKLREQDEKDGMVPETTIFNQVYVYINGYTKPSKNELKNLILSNGGNFESYQTSRVTHVIASNLPATKVREFQKKKNPLPVLHPNWILQSIERHKRLPEQDFLLDCLKDRKQSSIQEFSLPAKASTEDIHSTRDGPGFVKQFFSKSRLHHIGSWRVHYQQLAYARQKHLQVSNEHSKERVILHVDMDCFFVAVAIRKTPERLESQPIAIAHSGIASGYSEISSCNYLARSVGVRAGMMMKQAKALCPTLQVLPYDFEAIYEVSNQMYEIFFEHAEIVQAVSCDEALLQLPQGVNGLETARNIRQAIFDTTQCHCSVGISHNILLARLATKQAKPRGQFELTATTSSAFLQSLPVSSLPGVGWKTHQKLEQLEISTCRDVMHARRDVLEQALGHKTTEMICQYARGLDARPLSYEIDRKSISAEINYGIRLDSKNDVIQFMHELAQELFERLDAAQVRGQHLTLRLKKKTAGSAPARKYLGHGYCDNVSTSRQLLSPTNDVGTIATESIKMVFDLKIAISDLRGIGLQMKQLVDNTSKGKTSTPSLTSWLRPQLSFGSSSKASLDLPAPPAPRSEHFWQNKPLNHQIDQDVLQSLPVELQQEIMQSYAQPRVPHDNVEPIVQQSEDRHRHPSEEAGTDLRMSQVDPHIFNQLPETIRKELMGQFAQMPMAVISLVEEEEGDIPTTTTTTDASVTTTWNRKELVNFFKENPEASQDEGAFLQQHLHTLVSQQYLTELEYSLRSLRRQCASSRSWQVWFNTTFDSISREMQQRYDGRFHAISPFNVVP